RRSGPRQERHRRAVGRRPHAVDPENGAHDSVPHDHRRDPRHRDGYSYGGGRQLQAALPVHRHYRQTDVQDRTGADVRRRSQGDEAGTRHRPRLMMNSVDAARKSEDRRACMTKRRKAMRTVVFLILIALSVSPALAREIRRDAVPETFWGTWAPGADACK